MRITVGQIAEMLNGEVEGNLDIEIMGPAKIEDGEPGTLTFLANDKYEKYLYDTKSSAVLVSKEFQPQHAIEASLIRVDDVYQSVGQLLAWYESNQQASAFNMETVTFIDPSSELADDVQIGHFSVIEAGVKIGAGSYIYPNVYIGKNVKIGERVILHPGARIMHETEIGDGCIIYANAVIGSDGFGYVRNENGFEKIPQIGKVILEDEVEIGAGTIIDRATMGATLIKKGAKLDNMIQIGHNVIIGAHTVIAAQTGIAGSAQIGEDVMIGGQVGIAGHIKIANKTMIQAKSGLNKDIVDEGMRLYGYPAFNYNDYLKSYVVFRQLPDLLKEMNQLKKELKELKERKE